MRESIAASIEARRFAAPMKRALFRVLDGEPYRPAARAEGVGYRDLNRNAKTVPGLREAHLRKWKSDWGAAFPAVWRHHVADLDEPDDGPGSDPPESH